MLSKANRNENYAPISSSKDIDYLSVYLLFKQNVVWGVHKSFGELDELDLRVILNY